MFANMQKTPVTRYREASDKNPNLNRIAVKMQMTGDKYRYRTLAW